MKLFQYGLPGQEKPGVLDDRLTVSRYEGESLQQNRRWWMIGFALLHYLAARVGDSDCFCRSIDDLRLQVQPFFS
jgi:hypothetical protein